MKNLTIHLKLFAMAMFWGASWPWSKIIGQSLPPLTGGALRFMLSAVLLLAWLYWADQFAALKKLTSKQWFGLTLASLFGVVGNSAFFMIGLQYTVVSKATVVVALNPVFTLFFSALIFREKLNLRVVGGMLLAFFGSLTVITHGQFFHFFADGFRPQEWIVFGCVVCWVIYTLISRVTLRGIDALTATTVSALTGAIMLTILAVADGSWSMAAIMATDAPAWWSLAGTIIGSTVLAYAWFFEGVKILGAGNTAAYLTLVPIFGVLGALVMLGESADWSLIIGGMIAVSGMAIMQWGQLKK